VVTYTRNVARYRIRHPSGDLVLMPGNYLAGRSGECEIALDDALVSRRHALFRATDSSLSVEDLGSRNGVLVNGQRITGVRQLHDRDVVTIGGQQLLIVEVKTTEREPKATGTISTCPTCRLPVLADATSCPHCGVALAPDAEQSRVTMELTASALPRVDGPEPVTQQVSAFRLVAGIADKALALGRADEAERLLATLLDGLLAKLQQEPERVPADSFQDAVVYALRLADGTGRARWVDWVFQAHAVRGRLMAATTVDELYRLVRKVKHPGGRLVTEYVAAMRAKSGDFGPADRFVLQRLEGLERSLRA
jgi:hypothetical protein